MTNFTVLLLSFSRPVMSDSLRPHGLQPSRSPCPLPSSGVCQSSHPLLWWCYPILWCSLLLPSIFPAIRDFSNELAIRIRWPKYWSFSFSISPSSEYSGLISLKINRFDLPTAVQGTLRSLLQHHSSKSDWLYSLQLKMEKLYTVSKNKTGSWLWLRSWTPYCQMQT